MLANQLAVISVAARETTHIPHFIFEVQFCVKFTQEERGD
jgi:hypothetical protein